MAVMFNFDLSMEIVMREWFIIIQRNKLCSTKADLTFEKIISCLPQQLRQQKHLPFYAAAQ
jgi:hypothetical protein